MEQKEKLSFLTVQQAADIKPVLNTLLQTIQQDYQEMISYFNERIWEIEEKLTEKDQIILSLQDQIVRLQKKYGEASEQMKRKEFTIFKLKLTIDRIEKQFKESVNQYLRQIESSQQQNTSQKLQNPLQSPYYTRINISDYFMKASERSQRSSQKSKDLLSTASTFSKKTLNSLNQTKSVNKSLLKSEGKRFSPSCFETVSQKKLIGMKSESRTTLWRSSLEGKGKCGAVGKFTSD